MRRYTLPLSLAAVVLALDAITKVAVRQTMALYESREVLPGLFNLVHVLNKGAAFGILSDENIGWQRAFLAATAVLAVGVILWLLHSRQVRDGLGRAGLGLVLGGALGNLVDRIRIGYVTDFLDFYWNGWHWPAFNVADMGISCGVGLLIISFYVTERRARRGARPAGGSGA